MNKLILDPITKRFIDTGKPTASEEIRREKVSLALRGRPGLTLGTHLSEEAKRKISLGNQGKYVSEDTRKKLSLAIKAYYRKPGNREKTSIAMKRSYQQPEVKRRHTIARNKAMKRPEVREKIRLANIGKHPSEDTKRKIRIATSKAMQRPEVSKLLHAGPNKSELLLQSMLNKYFPNEWKYVGDLQVNIGGKFPDFININGKKEVIELFGSHWHGIDEAEKTTSHYRSYGFSCVVVWEEELKDCDALVKHLIGGGNYTPIYSGNVVGKSPKKKPVVILDAVTKRFIKVM